MPLALRSSTEMQTRMSAWTPLNRPLVNSKVFHERRSLLAKWFDRWSDSQRKAVLQDLVLSCSVEQLRFLSLRVSRQLPLQAADFTGLLPRAISLYVFSFLDPRSLCRCAQVSWHWRSIVEVDQLWMPKCLRLGWSITLSPTPYEQGAWKRHYVQTVQELQLARPQVASRIGSVTSLSHRQFVGPDGAQTSGRRDETSESAFLGEERPASNSQQPGSSSGMGLRKEKQPAAAAPPPWRDSDRRPKDTHRFNYLDNLDPNTQSLNIQMTSRATTCRSVTLKPEDRSQKTLSEANYKLRKAKSLMFLSSRPKPDHFHLPLPPPPPQAQTRPQDTKNLLRQAQWNAGIRPGPVRSAVPQLSGEALRASRRSHRSAPSTPLFEVQPSTVSPSHTQ